MRPERVLEALRDVLEDPDEARRILDALDSEEQESRAEDAAAARYEDAAHGYDLDEATGHTFDPNTGISAYDLDPGPRRNDAGEWIGYM